MKKKTTFQHALKGRVGINSNKGKESFQEITGSTHRDEDPDGAALPPHLGKQKLYERWCYENGWIAKRNKRHSANTSQ
eukprot:3208904-Ditylum_brightwellii.AAC.1